MKTHCNIIKDLLPMYLENECSEESKQLVEEHLSECDDCSQFVHELKTDDEIHVTNNSKQILKKTSNRIIQTLLQRASILLALPILWALWFADEYANRFSMNSRNLNYTEILGMLIYLFGIFVVCWIVMLIFSSFADRCFKENRMLFGILILTLVANGLFFGYADKIIFYNEAGNVQIQEINGNVLTVYDGDEFIEIEMADDLWGKNRLTANDGTKLYNLRWKESSILGKKWLYDFKEQDFYTLENFRNRHVIEEEYLEGYMISCIYGPAEIDYQIDQEIVEVHETTFADIDYVDMIQDIEPYDLDNYLTYEIGNHEKNGHYTTVINKNTKMIVGYKVY